jgi:hypothetical protein
MYKIGLLINACSMLWNCKNIKSLRRQGKRFNLLANVFLLCRQIGFIICMLRSISPSALAQCHLVKTDQRQNASENEPERLEAIA